MWPILWTLTFDTPGERLGLYAVALALVAVCGLAGWKGSKEGSRLSGALSWAAGGAVLCGLGVRFLLGHRAPLYSYGLFVGASFSLSVLFVYREASVAYPEDAPRMKQRLMDAAFCVLLSGLV